MTSLTRRIELGALFAALLGACGEGEDPERLDSTGSASHGCGSPDSHTEEVPADQVVQPLECEDICGAQQDLECSIIESGTSSGSDSDTSTTTGGPAADEMVVVECTYTQHCIGGRKSAAWAENTISVHVDDTARWLVRAAHDEAASVASFRLIGAELAAHGAPAELLARIEAAAEDEAQHAEAMAALARARGVAPVPVRLRPVPPRTLEAIALENAIEGCARETFNALVAAHQAERAVWPALRDAMAAIARDERRHAELAWAIDAWLCERLDPDARGRVVAARAHALAQICATPNGAVGAAPRRELGLPSPDRAATLARGLCDALLPIAA